MKNKQPVSSNDLTKSDVDKIAASAMRRGERINNPLNIEKSANKWQGLAVIQPDSRFAAFISPEYGIRAFIKILRTYYYTYRLTTLTQIINRYAPPVENDTGSYVRSVSQATGIQPLQTFAFNYDNLLKIAKAMIKHEQGRVIYSDLVISEGVKLGLK
jgi:hypothetical protein